MSDAWDTPSAPPEQLAAGLVLVRRHAVDVEDTGRTRWQITVQVGPRESLVGGGGARALPEPVRAALRAWLAAAEAGGS